MKNNNFHRSKCALCNSSKLSMLLKMPSSQPVDNFRKIYSNKLKENHFEMDLYLCTNCNHVQLKNVVSPKILFGDYIYESKSSPDLFNHFKNYAYQLFENNYINQNSSILDIGSNDGLFLDFFKKKKIKTYGIDPASKVSEIAKKKGHKIFVDFFNNKSALMINKYVKKKFDLITANNVFSHSENLRTILKCAKKLLSKNGLYIFEVSYLLDTIRNRVLDYIYHEHLSYHGIKSLVPFLRKEGLYIYDIFKIPTKGGSIRVVCGRDIKKQNNFLIKNMISAENEYGIYKKSKYNIIKKELESASVIINRWIENYKRKSNETLYFGYGASATSTVLLRFLKIDKYLSGIIDDNQLRQGLLSPNSFLPIINLKILKNKKNIVIFILSWRFEKSIKQKIYSELGKNVKVIVLKPNLKKIIN